METLKILIVDDDQDAAEELRMLIQLMGYFKIYIIPARKALKDLPDMKSFHMAFMDVDTVLHTWERYRDDPLARSYTTYLIVVGRQYDWKAGKVSRLLNSEAFLRKPYDCRELQDILALQNRSRLTGPDLQPAYFRPGRGG